MGTLFQMRDFSGRSVHQPARVADFEAKIPTQGCLKPACDACAASGCPFKHTIRTHTPTCGGIPVGSCPPSGGKGRTGRASGTSA